MLTINPNQRVCLLSLPFKKDEVIRQGQFALDVFPLEQIKSFMQGLFNLDIENALIWFDKLDCRISWRREPDDKMDLNKFLSDFKDDTFVRLQIGSPTEGIIRFGANYRKKDTGISHLAWFQCDLTLNNYKKIDRLFKKAFRLRIKEAVAL